MDRSLIKKHKFDGKIKDIRKFSEELPEIPYFDRVEEDGGLFNLFSHNVTGKELNAHVEKVEEIFISIHDSLITIVKEFGEVYKAFGFLDNEYIAGILHSIDSAEKAANNALKAQEDINKTIETLVKTIESLEETQKEFENLKGNVNSLQSLHQEMKDYLEGMRRMKEKIETFEGRWDTEMVDIKSNLANCINVGNARDMQIRENKKHIIIAYAIAGSSLALAIGQIALRLWGIL